jgi:transcription-repair coupling factor (superfamily II helicase)
VLTPGVADLGVRLGLYRRIAALLDRAGSTLPAEMIDRFGPLPPKWRTCCRSSP